MLLPIPIKPLSKKKKKLYMLFLHTIPNFENCLHFVYQAKMFQDSCAREKYWFLDRTTSMEQFIYNTFHSIYFPLMYPFHAHHLFVEWQYYVFVLFRNKAIFLSLSYCLFKNQRRRKKALFSLLCFHTMRASSVGTYRD